MGIGKLWAYPRRESLCWGQQRSAKLVLAWGLVWWLQFSGFLPQLVCWILLCAGGQELGLKALKAEWMYCSIAVLRKHRPASKLSTGLSLKKSDKFEANLDRGLETLKSRAGSPTDSQSWGDRDLSGFHHRPWLRSRETWREVNWAEGEVDWNSGPANSLPTWQGALEQ